MLTLSLIPWCSSAQQVAPQLRLLQDAPGSPDTITAADLKRAAHAAVVAKRAELGERVLPRGFVNLEVTFDEDTDKVLGARLYYSKTMSPKDDPEQAVKV